MAANPTYYVSRFFSSLLWYGFCNRLAMLSREPSVRVRAFIMGYNRNVNMCTTFYSAKTNERASIYYSVRCVRAPVPDDKCAPKLTGRPTQWTQ